MFDFLNSAYRDEQKRLSLIGGGGGWTTMEWNMRDFFSRSAIGDSIPLGIHAQGGNLGVFWNIVERQGHGLCFAPNRGGKGASVIIPALLTYKGSIVVIDPKGENAWVTAEHRRNMSQRVVLLDPWDEVNRYGASNKVEKPTKFNPIGFLDSTSPTFVSDINALSEALIVTPPEVNDPHWPDSARSLVGGIIALVREAREICRSTPAGQYLPAELARGYKGTLRELRQLIMRPDRLFHLMDDIKILLPNSFGIFLLEPFRNSTTEIRSIISAARTQTAFLDDTALLDGMEDDHPTFDLRSFTSCPTTIYLVLPPDKLVTHGRWLRMLLSMALDAVVKAGVRPTLPTLMLVDEMGTIGPLKALESGFGLLSGYGIRFFGFLQSLSQLQGDYPKTWRNFFANCAVVQVLGATDMETATEISNMLGTTSVPIPKQVIPGKINFGPPQYNQRPLMFPEEIMSQIGRNGAQLERNVQIVMFRQGGQHTRVLQNPYFRERRWAGWYRNPPQFGIATTVNQPSPQHATTAASSSTKSRKSFLDRWFEF